MYGPWEGIDGLIKMEFNMKGGIIMKSKKGISAVVATVLIILITVAAVTIIWAAIIPMINDQLERGTVCLDAMTQLSVLNKGYTCYDAGANEVQVQVGHGAKDIGLAGIQVLVSSGGSTTSTEVIAGLPGINSETVLTVSSDDVADSVKIAPMITVGNAVETCDALAAVELDAC
jgi:flagellin-like protein